MSLHITKNNFLTTFKDYVKSYKEGLFGLVWALITLGLERILDKDAFDCPKTGYRGYGVAFFVSPILILTLLNWLTMPTAGGEYLWTLCRRCMIPAYHRRGDVFGGLFSAVSVGLVAPAAWVFLALLDGEHLVCWELGYQIGDNVTDSYLEDRGFGYLTIKDYDDKVHAAKSKSHTAAVIFLGCAVVFFCFIIVLKRSYLKPFEPDNRLRSLCYYEEREAFEAKEKLDRMLDDDDQFDQFSTNASLMKFLIIRERTAALKQERKNETDEHKALEIEHEINELKELERVLHLWADWYKLNMALDFKQILSTSEKLQKAKSKYESARDELKIERKKRIDAAKKILEEYKSPTDKTMSSAEIIEAIYQSWLITRMELQDGFFDIDEVVKSWEDSKEEIKRLKESVESELDRGYVDSPKIRGRIVASYLIHLYKSQNKFCLTLEQVMEKFKSIYPRVSTSDPSTRYVDVDNPMYQHILDAEPCQTSSEGTVVLSIKTSPGEDNGQKSPSQSPPSSSKTIIKPVSTSTEETPARKSGKIPLLNANVKPWDETSEEEWKDYMFKHHEHSLGHRLTGCLKPYCPSVQKRRKKSRSYQRLQNSPPVQNQEV